MRIFLAKLIKIKKDAIVEYERDMITNFDINSLEVMGCVFVYRTLFGNYRELLSNKKLKAITINNSNKELVNISTNYFGIIIQKELKDSKDFEKARDYLTLKENYLEFNSYLEKEMQETKKMLDKAIEKKKDKMNIPKSNEMRSDILKKEFNI